MQDHTRLDVWQRARGLTVRLHLVVRGFAGPTIPGLAAQLMKSCAAMPANIAEGSGQETPAQFARFLTIAIGSANELESHLSVAHGVGLLSDDDAVALTQETVEIRRMLFGLRKRVRGG